MAHTNTLEIKDLSVAFRMYGGAMDQHDLQVIRDLSLTVRQGEILAVAGSSGSGKSLLVHAVLGVLPGNAVVGGEMRYRGEALTPERQAALRGGEIAFVPQSVEYLDPLMRVGRQVVGTGGSRQRMREAFSRYKLAEKVERLFPFQLSGGMARRVLVSTAVVGDAHLILADEPTPGLGKDIADRAMGHFRALADAGCAVLLVTHDLDLAVAYADRVAVFYAGTTVEVAPARDFHTGEGALRHPYSLALWRAMPQNGFAPLPGTQPYAGELPLGCLFSPRCGRRTDACGRAVPMREIRGGEVRCVHAT